MSPTQPANHRAGLIDLPLELQKLIIQRSKELAEQEGEDWDPEIRALSLVSRHLTSSCQEALFEVVDIEPPKFRFGKEIWKGSDTLSSFPRLMKASPHLGEFVRRLTITFPLNPDAKISAELAEDIANALDNITNLAGLSLQHEDETFCKAWQVAIPEMRHSAKLGRLAVSITNLLGANLQDLLLRNVTVADRDLTRCTSLTGLHLINAGLNVDRTLDAEGLDKPEPIHLETLEVTGSTDIWGIFAMLGGEGSRGRPFVEFSLLEDLTIPLIGAGERCENPPDLVLPQAPALRSLHLHAGGNNAVSQEDDDGLCYNALTRLNPASYSTLTHLILSIEFDIADTSIAIEHPYLGHFSDSVLTGLTALRGLEVEVWISGDEARNIDVEGSCGPQWGLLDSALVSGGEQGRCRLPRLEEVSVLFGMIEDEPDIRPDEIFDTIKRRVFKEQFPRLRKLDHCCDLTLILLTQIRFRRF